MHALTTSVQLKAMSNLFRLTGLVTATIDRRKLASKHAPVNVPTAGYQRPLCISL